MMTFPETLGSFSLVSIVNYREYNGLVNVANVITACRMHDGQLRPRWSVHITNILDAYDVQDGVDALLVRLDHGAALYARGELADDLDKYPLLDDEVFIQCETDAAYGAIREYMTDDFHIGRWEYDELREFLGEECLWAIVDDAYGDWLQQDGRLDCTDVFVYSIAKDGDTVYGWSDTNALDGVFNTITTRIVEQIRRNVRRRRYAWRHDWRALPGLDANRLPENLY